MRPAAFALAAVLSLSQPAAVYGGTCDSADTLLKGNLFDDAQKSYIAILKIDPAQQCARTGLETIAHRRANAEQHRELARAYKDIDKQAAKREALAAEALGIPQPPKEPVAAAKPKAFDKARRLGEAGLYEEARAQLADSIAKDDPADFPEKLRYLTGMRVYHFLRQHQESVFLSLVAAALLLPFVVRRVKDPRLKMDDLHDPSGVVAGRGASLLLQQQLLSLTRAQNSGLQFVTSPLTQVTVPAAISTAIPTTLDWVKPLLTLLSTFYLRQTLTLTGSLHPAIEGRGVGLTLVLSEGETIVSTHTIWQNEYGTKPRVLSPPAALAAGAGEIQTPAALDLSPYCDLAEPAAIWLLFQLLQRKYDKKKKKDELIRRVMGTTDWKSYALNAAGVRARRFSSRRAQDMLAYAIDLDSENAAARANLGAVIHARPEKDERLHFRALEQLRRARPKVPSVDGTADPVLYTASYSIAHVFYSLYALNHKKEDLQESATEIRNLVNVLRETKAKMGDRNYRNERFRNFVDGTLPMADVMRIGVEAELGTITPATAHQQLALYRDHPSPEAQYNLACCYSVLAKMAATESADRIAYLSAGLDHLDFALSLAPVLYDSAKDDPTLATLQDSKSEQFKALIDAAKKAEEPEPAPDAVLADRKPALPKQELAVTTNLVTGRPLQEANA